MAGNIGDLQFNLTANTSQLERDVAAALRRLESKGFNLGAGINARAFTQPLGRITGAANEFQKSLDASNARVIAFGASAGAIYNVQRAFTALIGSTIEVQKSLTDINVILNASSKTLGQFGDQLFEIARNSGQAFSTVATAAGELARQGLTIEQTLKRTSDALILARLSGLDAASSVEALTASINSFNQSALDSTQIVNKLASVDAAFAVSSSDLAEALKRVGSSAQDVGVSFDELLAIVASVNQTTARGGAVIGNSLKTIFTRIQRTDVLDQLESLGVAVRDLEGNTAPAIQVLTGLASKFDQLGSAQKAQVAELVGGVFQINVLKAALGDLSREYSVFGNALKVSTNASDEAIRRNEELNKTLSALLNRTVANLTKVGSEIGGLTFAPAIEKVLNGLNTALEGFNVKGDSIGSKIGKGIFEGIGSFVSGPGLALLIGVFLKIFGNLAKFTGDAARTILGLNKEAQAQAQIQERINNILAQNPQLVQNILNKQTTLLQVERDILTVIQAQSQARQQSAAVATNISRGLISKGVTVQGGAITARTKSQGFIPNFSANREIMGAISGGYMPGQVRSMNIPNYGRITYNTAEEVKRFPGLSQPGIMPPEGSEAGKNYKQKFKNKYGIDPYASKGFVPNFLSAAQIAARLRRNEMTQEEATRLGYKSTKQKQAERTTPSGIPVSSLSPLLALRSTGGKQGYTFKPKDGPQVNVTFPVIPFDQQSTGFKLSDLRTNLDKVIDKSISDFATSIYKSRELTPPIDLPSTIEQARKQADGLSGSIEGTIGGIFESAFRAAFGRSVKATKGGANFDVAKIPKDLGIFFPGAVTGIPGDFKSSDSDENRRSMALKVLSNQQPALYSLLTKRTASQGFIPNFSPLEKAFSTEKSLGGKPTLDYKEGLGLYVRDGKTQPNFAAVMRDHPEGMQRAIKNSKMMQGMYGSGGFIPNFQALDPMSIFFLAQSFLGGGGGDAGDLEQIKLEQQKYRSLLRERNASLKLLKEVETAAVRDEKAISYARQEYNTSLSNLAQYQKQARLEGPIFTGRGATQAQRAADFARRGGVGGAFGRFGARYGSGIALAAPLATGVASQFVGDDVTRVGRAQKAGVTGLGTIASFAGLGALVGGGPIGAGVGATVGAGIAIYDVFKQLKDIMPEVAKEIEDANERFNNLSAGAQALNTSLETLRTVQERSDISAETRAKLVVKANEDFANGLNQIALASKPAADEILKLYQTLGDTPDLRERINLELAKSRDILDVSQSKGGFIKSSKDLEGLLDRFGPGFLTGTKGVSDLNAEELTRYRGLIGQQAQSLSKYFEGITGRELDVKGIEDLKRIYQESSGNLDKIKQGLLGLDIPASQAEAIIALLGEGKGDLSPVFDAMLEIEKRMQAIRDAQANMQTEIARGARPITNIAELQQAFQRPGGITSTALGRIDYRQLNEGLGIERNKAFTQDAISQFTTLSNEVGNTSKGIELMKGFVEEAAKAQKEYNDGVITLTQASEKLKYTFDKIMFSQNESRMFSDERAQAAMDLRRSALRQGNFAEGFAPAASFFDKFGDNAITTADKINQSFANLAENMQTGFEDAFGAFIDGTKSAEDAFRDFALNLAQQTIKEQFSIGLRSLLGNLTGGGGAATGIGGGGGIGGFLNNIFGGGGGGGGGLFGFASGGRVRKYSGGGYVDGGSGVRDDVPAMLTDGEYVLRKSAVNRYGKGMLDMLNQGGMVKGYAGGGGITPGLGERTAGSFINSLFSRGNDISSYLNDPFLQANNRMVYRGGKGGSMLSQPVPFEGGKSLHATPHFRQAAGYANSGFNASFRNVAGQKYYIGSRANLPFTQQSQMVQSFYNLEDRNIMRPGSGGSVYSEVMGNKVSGIKVKDFFNARVSDTVLNNLSPEQRSLISMKYYDGLELNAAGGRKGQAFLTSADEAVKMPSFLRRQIDKEIKNARISAPGYMDKATRGNYLGTLRAKNLSRGMTGSATFLDDVKMTAQLQGMNQGAIPKSSTLATAKVSSTAMKPSLLGGLGSAFGRFFSGNPSFAYALPISMMAQEASKGSLSGPALIAKIQASSTFGGWTPDQLGIKGYATGGGVSSLLSNRYDFYGAAGERLTTQYTPEAFATTVTGPEQLGNVPALTGRFNISDLLSSRAMVNEDNPMVALRNERFRGMESYQQQVANFKTGYNEQMRQVEEARRKAQEEANRINSERMAAYNRQRTGMLVGGLLNVGLQGFSALSSSGFLGGGMQGLFGGGGGGGGGINIGGLFQDIAGRAIGFVQNAITGGGGMSGGTVGGISPEQQKYMSEQIRQGQRAGYQDPFRQQAQLFPQFGGAGGYGGGFGGSMFAQPSSSFGGFQYNVGLGTPAGFQTQFQNPLDFYRTNFANPVAPLTYGRGNLITTNPYDSTRQFYAKGGLVKGYQGGGKVESFVNRYYPYAVQAAQKLGTSPEAILSQLALESGYGTSKLSGSFNLGGLTAGKNYKGSTVSLPANKYDKNIGIYGNRTYRAYNSPQEFFDDYVAFLSRDRYKGALGITDPAARASALAKAQYVMGDPNYSAKIQRIAGRLQPVIAQNMLSGATMMADYRTIQTELDRQIKYASNVGRNAMSTDVDPEGAFITRGANISQRAPQQTAGFSFKLPQMFGTLDAPVRNPFAEANAPFFRPSGAPLKGPISTKTYTGPYVGPGRGGYPSYEAIKARVQAQGTGTGGAGSLFPDYNKIALDNLANQIFGGAGLAAQRLGGGAPSLYQDVGSLLDLRDRGNYARIASRFAPFYGGTAQNRFLYQPSPSNFGQTGFNNYLKYIGLNPLTTSLDSLASYRAPMTPGMYSPYAFASSYFGGFGGSGYQSGFSSTGNVFSNYFSTGSRLGITPSWQARATGGPIYGGSSYRDDVPAMLMGGEYVIRKDVVDRMGQPFFDRLNRGQMNFAEGGPVGTGLPSIGVGGEGNGQQDNSRVQFIEALTKLLRSLDQLNKTVEEQTRQQRDTKESQVTSTETETSGGGVTNNITISVNVDQNGKTTDTQKQENQDSSGNDMNDQEKFKKTLERSRMLSEMLRQQVLKVIVEEQRPGGVLYQGSKGRDMGR